MVFTCVFHLFPLALRDVELCSDWLLVASFVLDLVWQFSIEECWEFDFCVSFSFSEISRSHRISLDTRSLGSNYIPILFSLRKKNETVFRHSYTVKIKDRREVLIIPHWEYSAKQALFCFSRSLLNNIKPKGVHMFFQINLLFIFSADLTHSL